MPYAGPDPARRGALPAARAGYQADDRQFTVRLALVLREAARGRGDLLPRPRALGSVQLLGRHADPAAVHLDPHLVRVGGDVVIPRRWPPPRSADCRPGRKTS